MIYKKKGPFESPSPNFFVRATFLLVLGAQHALDVLGDLEHREALDARRVAAVARVVATYATLPELTRHTARRSGCGGGAAGATDAVRVAASARGSTMR